ncbi:hypothetical protein BC828DRAFT_375823 [Blastocladiella britannica]|nr:hypothetical protein BC828DRAFT_375823 [Blastocladiella britannica]
MHGNIIRRRGGLVLGRSARTLATSTSPATVTTAAPAVPPSRKKLVFDNRKSFKDFMAASASGLDKVDPTDLQANRVPYLARPDGARRKFFLEVYGCQMNSNDTEILNAILHNSGYERTLTLADAEIVLLMTCAIRDNAEQKIWARLAQLRALRTKPANGGPSRGLQIGVLGCMAERLRSNLLDDAKLVDVVCGPDAYRSLPTLLALADDHHQVANVMLSADETYADIMPLRLDPSNLSAHLSIMRGCNNMCAFCIVPFTRGTERSRPVHSIVDEVRRLSDQGIREITLLGQNVNSYRDTHADSMALATGVGSTLAPGFSTIYKRQDGGLRFAELLDRVAAVDPELRIRFTSPHPKDFPDDLLDVINAHANIANQIHMPAQSGSTETLARMRRGYSRDAYLSLVDRIRTIIPGVALSTDIIAGFCGETESDHAATVSLMRTVGFDQAFMFAYSMREKTHAHRRLTDDVSDADKHRRLAEIIDAHYSTAKAKHGRELVGSRVLVLVEGLSRRQRTRQNAAAAIGAEEDGYDDGAVQQWAGRAENNLRVHFDLPANAPVEEELRGKYAEVVVESATGASLTGRYVGVSSVREFYATK